MAVDEQRVAGSIDVLGEAGEMDLRGRHQLQGFDEGLRIAAVIGEGSTVVVVLVAVLGQNGA